MPFPRPCAKCGVRIPSGTYCPRCKPAAYTDPAPSEAARNAAQPYRQGYRANYWSGRRERLVIARGRCEVCGATLATKEQSGVAWECHHVVALRDGGSNDPANLRCLCLDCHHPITTETRRARRGEEAASK
jgi:hypothetical protein